MQTEVKNNIDATTLPSISTVTLPGMVYPSGRIVMKVVPRTMPNGAVMNLRCIKLKKVG